MAPRLVVVGSINLDLVARAERLPRPGETVTGATFFRSPGGKGANQAVAAARLGADVAMIGCVGADAFADEALAGLREAGVDLGGVRRSEAETGVALITVDAAGENEIVVAPGANLHLEPGDVVLPEADGVLCQQEIPAAAVERAAELARGRFYLNAAPARHETPEADLTIVNRYELEALLGWRGLVCVTNGADGAVLLDEGEEIARAEPTAPAGQARRARTRRGRAAQSAARAAAAPRRPPRPGSRCGRRPRARRARSGSSCRPSGCRRRS